MRCGGRAVHRAQACFDPDSPVDGAAELLGMIVTERSPPADQRHPPPSFGGCCSSRSPAERVRTAHAFPAPAEDGASNRQAGRAPSTRDCCRADDARAMPRFGRVTAT